MNWMLSSDSHVIEPPSIWDKVPSKFRDAAPYVEEDEDADWWCFEGRRLYSFASASKAGLRFEEPDALKTEYHFSDVRDGALNPHRYVEENATDGVWGSVLYPSFAMNITGASNSPALTAMCSVYNDWLAEFCDPERERLKGVGMLNVDRVAEACAELRRIARLGLCGAMIPVAPAYGRGYELADYEPLWEAAEELRIPISLHIGTNREQQDKATIYSQYGLQAVDRFVRDSLARMIFGGVFERHPGLRVVSVEQETGWAPHFLERIDYTYNEREQREGWTRFRDGKIPSDFFAQNILLSFQEDPVGIKNIDLIGANRLMWGSDYPHTESTFPRSREIVAKVFSTLSVEDRNRVVCDNTRDIYGFSLPNVVDDRT